MRGVASTSSATSERESPTMEVNGNSSFKNRFVDAVGQQFHNIVDNYVPADLNVMDSVLTKRLNDRYIYPGFVLTEVVDSLGTVVVKNSSEIPARHDSFLYRYNPVSGYTYRAYITPLTHHIISEMAGVIITTFLLITAFSLAFIYLFRTVSRLRTLEEMKDDFVSNMTHELKTPIAIAYSANDALLNYDMANDAEKKERYLQIANRQLKRLGELVENILAMSMERRKTLQLTPEPIKLRQFVEEIAALQRMRGDKKIKIDVRVDDKVNITADKAHFTNVLNNLVDNAIKYSGDSVTITIAGDDKEISVADLGIGIPGRSISYIFNKFYRVPHGNRQDVRGYGIGLYYVKSIIDKMDWAISVSSREGEGSVFTIKFNNDER